MNRFNSAYAATRLLWFLIVISLSLPVISQQSSMQQVIEQYQQQYFELALERLESVSPSEPDYAYYRGLIHYQLFDFGQALPWLMDAQQRRPTDKALLQALTDIYRANQQWQAAIGYAQQLVASGQPQLGHFLLGKIEHSQSRYDQALPHFMLAADGVDQRVAQQAALAAAEIHYQNGRSEQAQAIAQRGIQLNPDSFDAYSLSQLKHTAPVSESNNFSLSLGYRLEYDDNVALVPEFGQVPGAPVVVSGQADARQVLTADVSYYKSLGSGLLLFSEAHLAHNRQLDLNQFDQTSINLVAGIGGSWGRFGWRLPLEYDLQRFDGEKFLSSLSLLPGIYYRPTDQWLLHLFARLGDVDDQQINRPAEDQGGDLSRIGLFVYGKPTDKLTLRAIVEAGNNDADGVNWERDETRAYAYLEYQMNSRWTAGAGVQYQQLEFDNIHDVFLIRRDDEIKQAFVSLAYQFNNHWELRAQASRVEQESNIDTFSHDRNVLSLGMTWEY